MRFALPQEHGVKSAAAASGSWSPLAPSLLFQVFLELHIENMLHLFLFSLESSLYVTCFFFIIIILNIHYLETAGAWKPISVLISKSLQRLGSYVQTIT